MSISPGLKNSLQPMPNQKDECPLCLQTFEDTHQLLSPCTCVFQLCSFCWYRIFISSNPVCPGCRCKYTKEQPLSQLHNSWIAKLEDFRSCAQNGTVAFEVLSMISYFDSKQEIPTSIFTSASKVVNLLESFGLVVTVDSEKSRIAVTETVMSKVRRCIDPESVLQQCMTHLLPILDFDLARPSGIRIETVKAYLPHAISVWSYVLDHDSEVHTYDSNYFFACLCDRLDQCRFYQQFLQVAQSTLPRITKMLGTNSVITLRTKSDVGTALWRLNRLDEALEILKKVLDDARCHLGSEHWLTLNILNEIAFVYNQQDRLVESLEICEEVCRVTALTCGHDNPDTLVVVRNKGIILSKLHRYADALELFTSNYESHKRVLGELHTGTLASEYWVGKILNKVEQFEEALKIHEGIFEKRLRAPFRDESAIIRCAADVAYTLNQLGRFKRSLTFCTEQSTRIQQFQTPSDSDDLLTHVLDIVKLNLEKGKAYLGLLNFSKAQTIIESAYQVRLQFLGENNPDTKRAKRTLKVCRCVKRRVKK